MLKERSFKSRSTLSPTWPIPTRPPLRLVVRKKSPTVRSFEVTKPRELSLLEQLLESQHQQALLQAVVWDLTHARSSRWPLFASKTPDLTLLELQAQEPEVPETLWPLPRRPRLRTLLLQLKRQPQKGLKKRATPLHLTAQTPQPLDAPLLTRPREQRLRETKPLPTPLRRETQPVLLKTRLTRLLLRRELPVPPAVLLLLEHRCPTRLVTVTIRPQRPPTKLLPRWPEIPRSKKTTQLLTTTLRQELPPPSQLTKLKPLLQVRKWPLE